MSGKKRVFGYFETVFDILYLGLTLAAGLWLLLYGGPGGPRTLAGACALVLAGGDAFHLVPRIAVTLTGDEARYQKALGLGKLVTSVTMTVFYVLLWRLGLLLFRPEGATPWTWAVYALAALRVILCLFPQNRWLERAQPVNWGVYRNLPFFLLGAAVAVFYGLHAGAVPGLGLMWLAILLSFAFYVPVVLRVHKSPVLGMLMFPKTCAYLWIVLMFFSF